MAKVITFSRVFPSYHPRAGQPTHFVEQIIRGLPDSLHDDAAWGNIELYKKLVLAIDIWSTLGRKYTTIRAGHRFKVGEWFKPVVWGDNVNPKSGKKGPYQSKQIQFAPEIQVKKVWGLTIDTEGLFYIGGKLFAYPNSDFALLPLAGNDGLGMIDFLNWFNYPRFFDGQIICWNENIEY